MNKVFPKGASVRSGVVKTPSLGYLLACDPELEEAGKSHTYLLEWRDGSFTRRDLTFAAHTCCYASSPEEAIVVAGREGEYFIWMKTDEKHGNIFIDSTPRPSKPVYGNIRSVAEIEGVAYAVGLRGLIYRLESVTTWTRLDGGLYEESNFESIHGFHQNDMYLVGRRGGLWQSDGESWKKRDFPTNAYLTIVKCAPDGMVYVAGHDGLIARGRDQSWEIIEQDQTEDDIWDLEWFLDKLYISTMSSLFRLEQDELVMVDFGQSRPVRCHHLSTASGVLWSIGEFDVMAFDGDTWTRIV